MFAQLIVGAPGAGKTTYCAAAREFLQGMGRNVAVVNLDPANDGGEYDVDIRDLVQLSEVMERLQLGPNGGLLFCLEYLEEHLSWLKEELERFQGHYILFDCPGQVELFTHHNSMRAITQVWEREWKMRICVVNLVDSHCCSDAGKFVSALLTSMSTMMQLELPHINVLSKIDLAEAYGQLPFNLEYYTEVLDLSYLLGQLADDPFAARYKALNEALVELIEDFSLVTFHPLSIKDGEQMAAVSRSVDRACGYLYTDAGADKVPMTEALFGANPVPGHMRGGFAATEKLDNAEVRSSPADRHGL